MERLSVMGLFEVAGRYVELLPARARLARDLIALQPDVFVGIDAPEFNLTLERKLRQSGIPVVHYVSPTVWAWRRRRLKQIGRAVDKMLCLFPFEPSIYSTSGIAAEFVGHPLADRISTDDTGSRMREARLRLDAPLQGPVVGLLPGSRLTEVSRLAEVMFGAARWLRARQSNLQFIVPAANEQCRRVLTAHMGDWGEGTPQLHVVDGQSIDVITAADVVLTASGTATLETMLVGRPMVITYKAMEMTWQIARRLSYVSLIGLPNLLAGRTLVPELLQHDASPERLGAAVLCFLERPDLSLQVTREFAAIGHRIRRDADQRAAEAVLELVL